MAVSVEEKFSLLCKIIRAQHFAWREALRQLCPDIDPTDVPAGTIYIQEASGGGGYGDPKERSVEKVVLEVQNEVISLEVAGEIYGVALDPQTLEIDEEKTARLRGA